MEINLQNERTEMTEIKEKQKMFDRKFAVEL